MWHEWLPFRVSKIALAEVYIWWPEDGGCSICEMSANIFLSIHGIATDFSRLLLIKFGRIFGQERLNQINRNYRVFIGRIGGILLGKSV